MFKYISGMGPVADLKYICGQLLINRSSGLVDIR